MSNFKHFSLLLLTVILLFTLSGCFYVRGFNGGYHHNSYNGHYDRDYHGYDHHRNYNRR